MAGMAAAAGIGTGGTAGGATVTAFAGGSRTGFWRRAVHSRRGVFIFSDKQSVGIFRRGVRAIMFAFANGLPRRAIRPGNNAP
jgi:hypothetical protein